MCGISCYLGSDKNDGVRYGLRSASLLQHRGPDDRGTYSDDDVTLTHTRLSIIELSSLGHQPMRSSCGRYVIIFNGEIYNHLDLRKKFLFGHSFNGHSDTETVIELFRLMQERMLEEMTGMWSLIIWDTQSKKIFVSRDRYGQKPLYLRHKGGAWMLASEIKPLLADNEQPEFDPTALVEYLALGNYGHLGAHTFFKEITQFPEGCYAWMEAGQTTLQSKVYWMLPDIPHSQKRPFDEHARKGLHDCIVEAVLSQTLSDVPIGITLSGGIDSSIITGILATYYDKEINIFTAQSTDNKFDETRYVEAVIKRFSKNNFVIHRKNLNELSIRNNLENYVRIQEEPFGDPSIIAHGFLMQMAADAGIKVILNGQGADELFFGYNNMAQAILSAQFRSMRIGQFAGNISAMKAGKGFLMRVMLESFLPGLEYKLRTRSRISRRTILDPSLSRDADNRVISLFKYNNTYNVWRESVYGVHIPHLVHYDDRNAMAYSIEGRMPFLDHRVAEYVAQIRPADFIRNGMRKYILRESCRQYLPEIVYNRLDKIGFYTPLLHSLYKDKDWVTGMLQQNSLMTAAHSDMLRARLNRQELGVNEALHIWRNLSACTWMDTFNIQYQGRKQPALQPVE